MPRARWRIGLLVVYVVLVLVTHLRRDPDARVRPRPWERTASVQAVHGEEEGRRPVSIAFVDSTTLDEPATTLILIHGSPGSNGAFGGVIGPLAERYRVIVPDLPGFGHSTLRVPDYSIRAHARYVLQLMDTLRVETAHVLGFSMGGGVMLEMARLAPQRVSSGILLSAIGVQEMELLGDYHLNHAIHGLQLGAFLALRDGTPHLGALDGGFLSVEYARNFFDTDQRPLRGILEQFEAPLLILHGDGDPLVPAQAAEEHRRIVPQSELVMYRGNHFMVFQRPGEIVGPVVDFVDRAEAGTATRRGDAAADRVAEAERPFDPTGFPMAAGFTLVVVLLLIAAATLVSEDLACIGAGLLVARGTIPLVAGVGAAFVGIYVGDVLLFLAGRYLGRPALRIPPVSWFVNEDDVERSSQWFRRRGAAFVFGSRFVPGTRLPTYFAAGMLKTSVLVFSVYFLLASALWTPALVGLSASFGSQVYAHLEFVQRSLLWFLLLAGILLLAATRLLVPLFSHRGRRLLVSRWRRITRWEFWPPWVFYPPVVAVVLWEAVRHRSIRLITAVNPGMEGGGIVGESKSAILRSLAAGTPDAVARTATLEPVEGQNGATLDRIMRDLDLSFPVVLKPDVGERGRGVRIARDRAQAVAWLEATRGTTIVQEYVAGLEFGVFYVRAPGRDVGRIWSLTDKRFPSVVGDGRRTLEDLILDDDRAVSSARLFLRRYAARLSEVPAAGERIVLAELGTHCRGAAFLDGGDLVTPALERAIHAIAERYEGFHFGRFDVRVPSIDALRAGRAFRIIELNGATSEATHIYDPRYSVTDAYRTLFAQWRLLFAVADANRRRGREPASWSEIIRCVREYLARLVPWGRPATRRHARPIALGAREVVEATE